ATRVRRARISEVFLPSGAVQRADPRACDMPPSLDAADLDLAVAAENVDADVVAVAQQLKVHDPASDAQVADVEFPEEGGQDRVRETELSLGAAGLDGEPEAGLDEEKDGRGGPGLRRAGDRVERGPLAGAAGEAAEELGHAVEVHEEAGVEEGA